jgi:hypothetical protein
MYYLILVFIFAFNFLQGQESKDIKLDSFVVEFENISCLKSGYFTIRSISDISYSLESKIALKLDGEKVKLIGSVDWNNRPDADSRGNYRQTSGSGYQLNISKILVRFDSRWIHVDSFLPPQKSYIILNGIFNKENESKDGYHFAGYNGIQIPKRVIQYIDKKKTEMKFLKIYSQPMKLIDYDSIIKNHPNSVPQCRYHIDPKTKKRYIDNSNGGSFKTERN